MTDSPKLRRLLDLRDKLQKGKLSAAEKKAAVISDTEGQPHRLDESGIMEVIEARIAQERAQ